MKLIIAGGRNFSDYDLLIVEVDRFIKMQTDVEEFEIVSGMARGADELGVKYAKRNNLTLLEYAADWDRYGKSAGYKRNEVMAKVADACICFWDGKSRGTGHMIDLAKKHNLILEIIYYGSKTI